MTRASALAQLVALGLCAACALIARPDRRPEIRAALADLHSAGFEFDADVRFEPDRYTVCEGLACADLVVRDGRRTVRLADEAFESPSRLRAALLEIWGRYRRPRVPTYADEARSALRIVQDGPRAGIDDGLLLRRAYHAYRQVWRELDAGERAELPPPDALPYP